MVGYNKGTATNPLNNTSENMNQPTVTENQEDKQAMEALGIPPDFKGDIPDLSDEEDERLERMWERRNKAHESESKEDK